MSFAPRSATVGSAALTTTAVALGPDPSPPLTVGCPPGPPVVTVCLHTLPHSTSTPTRDRGAGGAGTVAMALTTRNTAWPRASSISTPQEGRK